MAFTWNGTAPDDFYSWSEFNQFAPQGPIYTPEGGLSSFLEPSPEFLSGRTKYYQDRIYNNNPLSIGSDGTVTLWGNFDSASDYNPFRVSTTEFAGAKPFAASDPVRAGFNEPLEGWDRFWNQVFGSGKVQEEYVPTWYSGAQGKDTTNFDFLQNYNPLKPNWGLDQAALVQKPDDGGFLGQLMEFALPASLLAIPFAPYAFPSLAGGTGGAAAGVAESLSAIGPAQGSVLPAGLQASGAMTFPVANPYAGIELLGAGALGGSGAEMLNQLIYSDIGPAQGEILGAGLQESGAMVNPVTANPYAGITATPTNSIWDMARKIPSMPGGGAQPTGGDSGDGMSLWSNTVNPYAYAPPSTGTPRYQAHEATPYGFESELQRRLALIRGAR